MRIVFQQEYRKKAHGFRLTGIKRGKAQVKKEKADKLHQAINSQNITVIEVIDLSDELALRFEQHLDDGKEQWFVKLRETKAHRTNFYRVGDPHPTYRDARIAMWRLMIETAFAAGALQSYEARVGYAWDKLVDQPPSKMYAV